MTKEEKQQLVPFFGYAYYMKNYKRSSKYDKETAKEFLKSIETNSSLSDEIANAAKEESTKYNSIWDKAKELATQSPENIEIAKQGAKLENLKKLRALKTPAKKKCKCGCDMVSVKDAGGKLISQCSCNCGGGKVKTKAKGGVLYEEDIDYLRKLGVIDPSISNKWERKIHSNKITKFKK